MIALYYQPSCSGGALDDGLRVLEERAPLQSLLADACPHLVNLLLTAARGYRGLARRARQLVGAGLDEHGLCALSRRWVWQCDDPAESAAQFFVLRWGRWGRDGAFAVRPREWAWLWRAHRLLSARAVGFECADPAAFVRRHRLPPRRGLDCAGPPSRVPLVHFDVADLQAAVLGGRAGPAVEDAQAEAVDVDA